MTEAGKFKPLKGLTYYFPLKGKYYYTVST